MATTQHSLKALHLAFALCASCYASPIIYTGSVTGPNDTAYYAITTDGNITTPLDSSDITSVYFYQTGSNPFGPTAPFAFLVNGADLTAAPTELLFNFGGTDSCSFIMNDSGQDVLALLTPNVFGNPNPLEQTVFEPTSGPFEFFPEQPIPGRDHYRNSTRTRNVGYDAGWSNAAWLCCIKTPGQNPSPNAAITARLTNLTFLRRAFTSVRVRRYSDTDGGSG